MQERKGKTFLRRIPAAQRRKGQGQNERRERLEDVKLRKDYESAVKPPEYAQLVLGGEMERCLSLGCEYGRLED